MANRKLPPSRIAGADDPIYKTGLSINSVRAPAPAPVDPAKGNALLKKLFSSRPLPIVPDPEQRS